MAKRKVQIDDGAPAQTGPEVPPVAKAEKPWNYVVNFRHVADNGRALPHSWLPFTLTVPDCTSVDEAKKKIHELVDSAVYQIERARGG